MASNFDFLRPGFAQLHDDALQAERSAVLAPRTCAFYCRRTMERAIKWLYAHDGYLQAPYQENLAALLHEQTFKEILPPGLFNQLRMIHKLGNLAVHSETGINKSDALHVIRSLHKMLSWQVRGYVKGAPEPAAFDESLLPAVDATAVAQKTTQQLLEMQKQHARQDAALAAAEQKQAGQEEEIARLKAEIAAIKQANETAFTERVEGEEETRDLFIDILLREAGWDPHGANVAEYKVTGMPTASGEGRVDYVLWGADGLPLAVVEAKRTRTSPADGQRQAELYADALEKQTGQRPVIYFSNGYETSIWDDTFYPPRPVQGFHTRDELQLMVNRRRTRGDITSTPVNRDIVDRYYHEAAARRIMEAYASKSRAALVVMATGSGKTRLAVSAVEILMKQNWVRRVLFLADRTALLRQAKRAFVRHYPQASTVNLVTEKQNTDARIAFCTYPTMMNLIDEARSDGQKAFGPGYFDLIIIDEAHRSVYQKFGAIFNYFDAMLLGLTATPRSEIARNTYQLFDLEDHVPTFAYELEQAVADGHLVPEHAISVPLKFMRDGVKYTDLSPEEQEEYEEKFHDDDTGLPAEINPAALNQWLYNADTVDKVLKQLMQQGQKVEGGDRLGKTIIFARNQDHARFIVERFDKNYPHLAGTFCQRIDHSVYDADGLIEKFSVPDKPPHIAVSVDMLDTGIDVPEVLNLVFFKIVRSRTKFWQMVGRGTRTCEDLFGPGMHKQFFYIFDYCQNLEFFGGNPEGYEAPVQEPVKQKIFKRRLNLALKYQAMNDLDDASAELRSAWLDALHGAVQAMNVDNFLVRPHRRHVEMFSERERWDQLSAGDAADIELHLSGLPTPDNDDEFARRFDLLLLNLQLAVLETAPEQDRLQQRVCVLAANLESKQTIPAVAQQMELILEIQTEEYWQNVTLPMLEQVRRRLRGLIRFTDRDGPREMVYTDFEDEMGEAAEVAGLIRRDANLQNYHLKMERFIRENETHITIARLKNNEPISQADLQALEEILFSDEGPGSREEFESTYGTDRPIGELVRTITGLDRAAAKQAFSGFLEKAPLSGDQIQFINTIIEHLVINGVMEPKALFDPPFTQLHDEGVLGVLPNQAQDIVAVIKQINANAVAG